MILVIVSDTPRCPCNTTTSLKKQRDQTLGMGFNGSKKGNPPSSENRVLHQEKRIIKPEAFAIRPGQSKEVEFYELNVCFTLILKVV